MKIQSQTDDSASKRLPPPNLSSLDSLLARRDIASDPTYGRYLAFPEQCREALDATRDDFLDPTPGRVTRVLVAAMGGSSIAGDFLSALSAHGGSTPVQVVRGFSLPAWTDASTLVIVCSHSGDTEETLALFADARRRGARCIAVTTGGRLATLAQEAGIDCLRYVFPSEPRTAFAPIFARLLAVARRTGVADVTDRQTDDAFRSLEGLQRELDCATPSARNPAKQLAMRLQGKVPLVIGGSYLAPAARLWRTQLNENAKVFAVADALPELHHNTVEGLVLPANAPALAAVLLHHDGFDARLTRRYALTRRLFEKQGIDVLDIDAGGDDALAAMLRAVYIGNLTSYYLARLTGVDPVRTEGIRWLKSQSAPPAES